MIEKGDGKAIVCAVGESTLNGSIQKKSSADIE